MPEIRPSLTCACIGRQASIADYDFTFAQMAELIAKLENISSWTSKRGSKDRSRVRADYDESSRSAGARCSPFRLLPDVAIVHEAYLPFDHFLAVLSVFHRLSLQVKVLGINGLFVKYLVELSAQVLQPVIPLRSGPVIA